VALRRKIEFATKDAEPSGDAPGGGAAAAEEESGSEGEDSV